MTKYLKYLFILLIAAIAPACEDKEADTTLDFIGDSLVARWDLPAYFPSRMVENYGKSGATIDYLEQYAGHFVGRIVVIEIGTNDSWQMAPQHVEAYSRRYIEAVIGLGAKRVYLYSVLPRDFENDAPDTNRNILNFNAIIKQKVKEYPQITYLDVYPGFLLDGKPNPGSYNDRLHLSPAGYEILSAALDKAL